MVNEPVYGGRRGHWVFKDLLPFGKWKIARKHDTPPFIAVREKAEENLHLFPALLNVAYVVDEDGLVFGKLIEGRGEFEVALGDEQLLNDEAAC